jgi:hypothetical protein
LIGRVGAMGSRAEAWAFPARRHILFAAEPDVYRTSLRAFALPALPPAQRADSSSDRLDITTVALFVQPHERGLRPPE